MDKHCRPYRKDARPKAERYESTNLLSFSDMVRLASETPLPTFWGGIQSDSLGLLSGLPDSGNRRYSII